MLARELGKIFVESIEILKTIGMIDTGKGGFTATEEALIENVSLAASNFVGMFDSEGTPGDDEYTYRLAVERLRHIETTGMRSDIQLVNVSIALAKTVDEWRSIETDSLLKLLKEIAYQYLCIELPKISRWLEEDLNKESGVD